MLIEENKPLAPFTTLGIGGPARWFVEALDEDEVVEATLWARQRGLPLFVLGGGSNLLVSDAGFDGLVLRVGLLGIDAHADGPPGNVLGEWVYRVAAGEDWDRFVQRAVNDNCAGIECLAGIPGTVGGTPVQNVGADGLLMEMHPNPDKAMSDGAQSLYPEQLKKLMAQLRLLAPVVGRKVA